MDVNNGRILSLVTVPSYDPNKFWLYDSELFRGWYSQDLFEPGSTFKPINLALALEEKVIQKDGVVEDIGEINVGGWTLSNWDKKGNGYIDYPKVLQVSSNVGMVKIMQNLDPTIYWNWLKNLGIKATPKNILLAEKIQEKRQASIEENIELANSIKEGLADAKIVIAANSTDEGTLYAAISNDSIIEAIEKFSGYKIEEDQIAENSIKEIGLHNIAINLSGDVSFEVTLEIVPET